MRERPILMSGPMVRATLADQKTQTRRILKPQPQVYGNGAWDWISRTAKRVVAGCGSVAHLPRDLVSHCPYGIPGDVLYVRERVWVDKAESRFYVYDATPDQVYESTSGSFYKTDFQESTFREEYDLLPSIHMPKAVSRLQLTIDSVRVERVQDISDEDARAEGVSFDGRYWLGGPHKAKGTPTCHNTAREAFASLWDSINGDPAEMAKTTSTKAPGRARAGASWAANPYVWAVTFNVTRKMPATTAQHLQEATALV